jgi:site-specific DNA-cytosine methylase
MPTMYCENHDDFCLMQTTDLGLAGIPCIDYAMTGLRLGVDGKTFKVLLSWCQWHLMKGTKMLFFENVSQFPLDLLRALMGHRYMIHAFLLSPEDAAVDNLSRKRLMVWMVLFSFTVALIVMSVYSC